MAPSKDYTAESIKVLERLEGVRRKFDIIEISKNIKKKGDLLVFSNLLKVKPRILNSAVDEGRILSIIPNAQKSKAGILSRLKTNREVKLFSQTHDLKNISARKLIKLIRDWNENIQKNPFLLIAQGEHDLIIGSLRE